MTDFNGLSIGYEVAKLLFQAIGALIVAKVAVSWALDRFKREKIWERQLAAQADVIAALFEMRRLYARWAEREERHGNLSPEIDDEENKRWKIAARRLDEASAIGAMLLPQNICDRLVKLEADREAIIFGPGDVLGDVWNQEYTLIDGAIGDLVERGRNLISPATAQGVATFWRRPKRVISAPDHSSKF